MQGVGGPQCAAADLLAAHAMVGDGVYAQARLVDDAGGASQDATEEVKNHGRDTTRSERGRLKVCGDMRTDRFLRISVR
jgi:hypothetical protein